MDEPADGVPPGQMDPGWPPWAGQPPASTRQGDWAEAPPTGAPPAPIGPRPLTNSRRDAAPALSEPQGPDGLAAQPVLSARRAALGLTAAGVAVVVFAASLLGMLINVFAGGGVGWIFGAAFVAACCYTAVQVRPSDLLWAVLVPPLIFAVLVVGHAAYVTTGGALSQVVAGMNGLLDDGPMLWAGTGAAALIAGWRRWRPISR